MRTEANIFKDLEILCTKPGYAHVIAYLSFRDNFISFSPEEITSDDLYKSYEPGMLLRTELSTLIGLAVKGDFNTELISLEKISKLAQQTDQLMHELHTVLAGPFKIQIDPDGNPILPEENPFEQAQAMREPIFYAAETAYTFQYKELGPLRYIKDNEWLKKNKGFCVQDAQSVIKALSEIQNEKIEAMVLAVQMKIIDEPVPFYAFTFTLDEVIEQTKLSLKTVENVVNAFCLGSTPCNQGFNGIGDFNETTACPIIKINDSEYLLLQSANLIEAIYESPFYWMVRDKHYKNIASKHRGEFTEQFCADRLRTIFGEDNVHENIEFEKNKGEIDVLVTYSNRAIILQAKSKKLTLEARKGNDNALMGDFKAAIQDAYDQGLKCAELLNKGDVKLIDAHGNPFKVRRDFREIYIFTAVSEHYPSLAFQAEQFLKYKTTDIIPPPFVMDIFFLDTLCELITDPLYFLDFVQRRIKYSGKIMGSNELAILSYHLRRNLYVPDDVDFIQIGDDVCADVDKAMHIRRENLPGDPSIEGILTRQADNTFGKLIQHIGKSDQDGVLDIGFFLLHWSEDAAKSLGDGIEKITRQTRTDKKVHDISLMFGDTGLTFHTNHLSESDMAHKLQHHCTLRKYKSKARKWFGLSKNVSSNNPFDIGLVIDYQWEYSKKMEEVVNNFAGGKPFPDLQTALRSKNKIGRNELCPCESGKKYKKCHGK